MNVFISYRRKDTGGHAMHLQTQLAQALPKYNVFLDITSIPAAKDWMAVIDEAIKRSVVLLVVVGSQWRQQMLLRVPSTTDGAIRDPFTAQDMVLYEVEKAIENGVKILPVIFDGVRDPFDELSIVDKGQDELSLRKLPAAISALRRLQSEYINEYTFERDLKRLVDEIEVIASELPSGHWLPEITNKKNAKNVQSKSAEDNKNELKKTLKMATMGKSVVFVLIPKGRTGDGILNETDFYISIEPRCPKELQGNFMIADLISDMKETLGSPDMLTLPTIKQLTFALLGSNDIDSTSWFGVKKKALNNTLVALEDDFSKFGLCRSLLTLGTVDESEQCLIMRFDIVRSTRGVIEGSAGYYFVLNDQNNLVERTREQHG